MSVQLQTWTYDIERSILAPGLSEVRGKTVKLNRFIPQKRGEKYILNQIMKSYNKLVLLIIRNILVSTVVF